MWSSSAKVTASLFALSIALASVRAQGQEARSEALVRGSALLESMDMAAAIPLLEQAVRERAGALAYYNLGLAYRAVGRYREALEAWSEYLRAPEERAPPERLDAVRREIPALERQCLRVRLRFAPSIATVNVDGRVQYEARASGATLLLDARSRRIEVSAPNHRTWASMLPGSAGEVTYSVNLAAIGAQANVTPVTAASDRRLAWWGWLGVGVLAAGAITAAALAVDGQRAYSDCARDPMRCAPDARSVQAALDARSTAIAVSVAASAAGALTVGASVTLMFAAPPASSARATRGPGAN